MDDVSTSQVLICLFDIIFHNPVLTNLLIKQDSNNMDIQSIDGEAFMAEINDQEERRTAVKTKVSSKGVSCSPILLISP
jgi:hypothetical protein